MYAHVRNHACLLSLISRSRLAKTMPTDLYLLKAFDLILNQLKQYWFATCCSGIIHVSDCDIRYICSTLPWVPDCFWKRKVVKRSTPLSQNPNSPMEQTRIFLAWRNQTPHRGVLPVLPSICVYFKNAPKSKKCVIIVAIENAKLKL